jgi:hypothetical protein
MATYAGHATANSGAFKSKMAALRDWGLITGSGDTIVLTDVAMKIAHPPSPEEAARALLNAFRSCSIFWKVYEDAAKGRDLDLGQLANSAVNNYGVSVGSKEQFVKSLVDSAEAVGLAQRISGSSVRFKSLSDEGPLDEGETKPPSAESVPPATDRRAGDRSAAAPVLKQVWPINSGEISFEIRSSHAINADAFGQVGKVVEQIQALARTLGDGEASDDDVSG